MFTCVHRGAGPAIRGEGGRRESLLDPIWREKMGKMEGVLFIGCFLETLTDLTMGYNTGWLGKWLASPVPTQCTGMGLPAVLQWASWGPLHSPLPSLLWTLSLLLPWAFGSAHCRLCLFCALTIDLAPNSYKFKHNSALRFLKNLSTHTFNLSST